MKKALSDLVRCPARSRSAFIKKWYMKAFEISQIEGTGAAVASNAATKKKPAAKRRAAPSKKKTATKTTKKKAIKKK